MEVSTLVVRKYIKQGVITYTNGSIIGYTRSSPSKKYVNSEDTRIVGILLSYSHSCTICLKAQFKNMSYKGGIFGVGGFVKGLGKFQYVEVCTQFTSYNDPQTGETYVLIFWYALLFGSS